MQDNQHIYLESGSLFHQIRACLNDSDDEGGKADLFQMDCLSFHYVGHDPQSPQTSGECQPGIFMDEVYETLTSRQGQYDLILWMNRDNSLVTSVMPDQDIDLSDFEQLLSLTAFVPRPNVAKCVEWWAEWDLPENVRRHVTQVAMSAYRLAVWMRRAGVEVDPILTHRAGLVHDLDKIKTLHEPGRHGQVSADFLIAQGYSELAEIVRNHLLGIFLFENLANLSWETKLVNFCDKLVEGDKIVSITERFTALKQRYPQSRKLIDSSEPHLWRLNDEICSNLSLENHEALVSKLNE
jgi:putative hydrolase of the HAD superfamily